MQPCLLLESFCKRRVDFLFCLHISALLKDMYDHDLLRSLEILVQRANDDLLRLMLVDNLNPALVSKSALVSARLLAPVARWRIEICQHDILYNIGKLPNLFGGANTLDDVYFDQRHYYGSSMRVVSRPGKDDA